jgi:hypothetical protein
MAKSSKDFDLYVEGLNEVLRAFRALPKDAAKELRESSVQIAEKYMVPSWKEAALGAGPWGPKLAESVKAKRDRIPAVQIGGNKKVFSGGASATMVRYPSDKGDRARSAKGARNRMPAAFGSGTNWISEARKGYEHQALREWGEAVDRIVKKWDTTP